MYSLASFKIFSEVVNDFIFSSLVTDIILLNDRSSGFFIFPHFTISVQDTITTSVTSTTHS